jgi:Flp pilus assembly protein TadD
MITTEQSRDIAGVMRGLIEGQELDAAIELGKAAVANAPRAEFYALLGLACARRGLADAGIDAFQRALRIDVADIATWTDLAEAQIERCDYDGASLALHFACELDPRAEHPSGKRARILIARGRKEVRAAAK